MSRKNIRGYFGIAGLASLLAAQVAIADPEAQGSSTLNIKKIFVDSSNQLVVEFAAKPGVFPSVPHVLDLPGPSHRVVFDFADAQVDKATMPATQELTYAISKQLTYVTGVRYSDLVKTAKPTARVVFDLPETVKVKPRVVKLEEGSVTINFGVEGNPEVSTAAPVQTVATSAAPETTAPVAQATEAPAPQATSTPDAAATTDAQASAPADSTAVATTAATPAATTTTNNGQSFDWSQTDAANATSTPAATPAVANATDAPAQDATAPAASTTDATASAAPATTDAQATTADAQPATADAAQPQATAAAADTNTTPSLRPEITTNDGGNTAAPTGVEGANPTDAATAGATAGTTEGTAAPATEGGTTNLKSDASGSTDAKANNIEAVKRYNAAVALHLQGKLADAIVEYQAALTANPNLSEAYSNLGLIFNQQHNYAQALAEFRKALAVNPKDAITYNGIGAALRAERDLDGAIKNWQTAVELDPHLATAHYNLGTAFEIQKSYEKAVECYREAVKNDYRLGEAYYRMGLIMERKHRADDAAQQFSQALKVSSNSEYSEDARQRLAYLTGAKKKTAEKK